MMPRAVGVVRAQLLVGAELEVDIDPRDLAKPPARLVHDLVEMECLGHLAVTHAVARNELCENDVLVAIEVVVIDQRRDVGETPPCVPSGCRNRPAPPSCCQADSPPSP